ncbi:hypothetical protein BGW80DRAFT_1315315 [Lactifluus volemus]|nr:hypothetical protein BGW80DRAFT_1315315 [Lactifluus volemus]
MVVLVGSISCRATFIFSRKFFQTLFHVLPFLTSFHPFSPLYLRHKPAAASCYANVSFVAFYVCCVPCDFRFLVQFHVHFCSLGTALDCLTPRPCP